MVKKRRKRPLTKQQRHYERAKREQRYGPLWDDVRTKVYQRDGFKCRACGKARPQIRKLNAHHILLLRVSQSNDPRNLITLCDECHREIETKAIRLLQAGGHRYEVVRMTYRWLIEKRAKAMENLLTEVNDAAEANQCPVQSDIGQDQKNT